MNENIEHPPSKRRKFKEPTKDELLQLDKEELVEQIIQLRTHNAELRNIVHKNNLETHKFSNISSNNKFDFEKCHYRRVLLRIMYFGWDHQGYAVQEHIPNTIEMYLFHALTKSCLIETREKSNYHRCGRTDKGVSAFGQVISITLRSKHSPEDQHKSEAISSELAYCQMLNRLLPNEIRAVAWMPIPDDKPQFSARFDCKRRKYKYYFPRATLNITAMNDACAYLIGSHDFRHLCKMDVGNGVVEYIREIFSADVVPVEREGVEPTTMYCLVLEANAFLWHQIRCIMGILLLVGEGKEDPSIIKELLNVEELTRKPQYNLALDVPLNLFHCTYELEDSMKWVYTKNELKRVIGGLQKDWAIYNIKSTMMKDCIQQLEETYAALCEEEEADRTQEEKERDRVMEYADGLLQGVRPKVYKPVLERSTCSTLEEKIESYKRRFAKSSSFTEKKEIVKKKLENVSKVS